MYKSLLVVPEGGLIFAQPTFKCCPKIFAYNPGHTCPLKFHVDFSSTKNVMDCGSNYPHVNLKLGPMTLLINENTRILKSHGLIAFV
jgi:hypothetical protein